MSKLTLGVKSSGLDDSRSVDPPWAVTGHSDPAPPCFPWPIPVEFQHQRGFDNAKGIPNIRWCLCQKPVGLLSLEPLCFNRRMLDEIGMSKPPFVRAVALRGVLDCGLMGANRYAMRWPAS